MQLWLIIAANLTALPASQHTSALAYHSKAECEAALARGNPIDSTTGKPCFLCKFVAIYLNGPITSYLSRPADVTYGDPPT